MNGDRLMYFQHTDISRVVFEGYVDDDEIHTIAIQIQIWKLIYDELLRNLN